MGVLWAAEGPVSPAGVRAALGTDLAYNTVQTILIRLWEKALVLRRRVGRGHEYWPAQEAAAAAAQQMRATLAGRSDREAVLQQFAATLDAADAQALRAFLSDGTP
jgi:predicted transcriptional regulator